MNNNKGRFLPHQFAVRRDILHLVQSAYAREYVSSRVSGGRAGDSGRGGGINTGGDKGDAGGLGGPGDAGGPNVMIMTEFIPYASSSPSSSPKTPASDDDDVVQREEKDIGHNTTAFAVRDLDVVYNPAKGMHYTDEIIRRVCGKRAKADPKDGSYTSGGGVSFHPIGKGHGGRERLTGEEVVALLRRSKVVRDYYTYLFESIIPLYSPCCNKYI